MTIRSHLVTMVATPLRMEAYSIRQDRKQITVSDSSSLVVTSAPIIVKLASSTQLSSSLNPAYFRNAIVTLTAVVSAESGVPTGSVTFQDGDTLLGTANLNAGTAILTVSNLRIGSHRITASYAGDSSFAASNSPVLVQHRSAVEPETTNRVGVFARLPSRCKKT